MMSGFPSMQMQHSSSSVSCFTLQGRTNREKTLGILTTSSKNKQLILEQKIVFLVARKGLPEKKKSLKMHENLQNNPHGLTTSSQGWKSIQRDKKSIYSKVSCKTHHLGGLWQH